jgi:hypothetical protein
VPVSLTEQPAPLTRGAPLHPMSVSEILDGSFRLLKRNLRTIAVVAAVFVVPVELVSALVQRATGAPNGLRYLTGIGNLGTVENADGTVDGALVVASVVIGLLTLAVTPFIAGAVARVIAAAHLGGTETPKAALGATLRKTWPLLASFLLVHLIEGLGWVMCVLPGAAAMTLFVLVAPAIVIEDLGPIAGMRRSWGLVRRNFWTTFGIAILAAGLTFLVSLSLALPFALLSALLGGAGWVATAAGDILAGLLARPIVAIVATLQYYDARIRVEGYDIQLLTASLARDPG